MSESLNELLERVDWARSEIGAVKQEIQTWARTTVYLTANPYTGSLFAEMTKPVPIGARARSGTITNEIRSALDGLASELAARNGKDGAYFPVANEESAFKTDRKLRERLKRFRDADRDALLAFRPFATGEDGQPGNLLLYGLHHADIKRKHHRLVAKTTGSSLGFVSGYVENMVGFPPAEIHVGRKVEVARVSTGSDATFRFMPVLAYAEPNVLRGRPVVETLHEFADMAEAIIRSFL